MSIADRSAYLQIRISRLLLQDISIAMSKGQAAEFFIFGEYPLTRVVSIPD